MAYGPVRFLYNNLVTDVSMITAASQEGGAVQLMELVSGSGAAIPLSVGPYTGTIDRTLFVTIDSVTAGTAVGQATYKWRWNDSSGWEATGVTTSAALTTLALGVKVAWTSHATDADFALGDAFSLRVRANYGTQMLIDGDPNTIFQSEAVDNLVINLGSAQNVTAFVMRNHNLVTGQSTCNLEAHASDSWGAPTYQQALTIADPCIEYLNETFQYWRMDPTDGALSFVSIGELFLGTYLELNYNAWWGSTQGHEYLSSAQTSQWGVRRQQGLAEQRTFVLTYDSMQAADLASLLAMQEALWDSATGNVSPLFVHMISDDGGSTLIFAHWMNWQDFRQTHMNPTLRSVPALVFQEAPVVSV